MKGLSRLVALCALALTILAIQQAQAQFDYPTTDVSMRLGANVVNRASMRTVGDVWLAVGADVKLRGGSLIGEGELFLGVDYYTRSSKGQTSSITAITLTQVFSIDPSEKFKGYIGAGAGAYVLKPAGVSAKTVFGGKFVLGYDINEKLFVEVNYHLTGKELNFRGDSTTFLVGYRF
ncbi:MAG: hypothetical protein RMM06_05515 [Armatimonadota bacterium]|nr:hypothetical protein [bacterium]MCS7308957.1 hypothetical protein [Armatimonadota bacterium]MDW8104492.1 hypothetical protein [Armatimonadota bacterium]MDW8290159.1 hypothetical protein [Armatimonadota bacterium]